MATLDELRRRYSKAAREAPKPEPKKSEPDIILCCKGCGNQIDPETCCCGGGPDCNPLNDGHSFVPMGCTCGYEKPRDYKPGKVEFKLQGKSIDFIKADDAIIRADAVGADTLSSTAIEPMRYPPSHPNCRSISMERTFINPGVYVRELSPSEVYHAPPYYQGQKVRAELRFNLPGYPDTHMHVFLTGQYCEQVEACAKEFRSSFQYARWDDVTRAQLETLLSRFEAQGVRWEVTRCTGMCQL